jgi:hypothetical protein
LGGSPILSLTVDSVVRAGVCVGGVGGWLWGERGSRGFGRV